MRLISNYISLFENPDGLFHTLTDSVNFEINEYNELKMIAGGNACIFKLSLNDKPAMLKCYIAELAFLYDKYTFLSSITSKYIPWCKYLKDEVYIFDALGKTSCTDVLLGEWIEGETLSSHIQWAAKEKDTNRLKELANKFDHLAIFLQSQPWAHGDLKPDNIMVNQEDDLILIDFDSLYYPLAPCKNNQSLGTASFQHPLRELKDYNANIDDYSIAIISLSLHALSHEVDLYPQYHSGDNIILEPKEIIDGTSKAMDRIEQLFKDNKYFNQLIKFLKEPCIKHELPRIEVQP